MDNVYQSRFSEYVKRDEMKRGRDLHEKSMNPRATGVIPIPAHSAMFSPQQSIGNSDSVVYSLTGEKMELKHNNMQPFLKGNVTQNTVILDNTPRLDMNTGVDKLYIKKREVPNMFKPTEGFDNMNGSSIYNDDFMKDRIEISKITNNVSPIEKIRVGPGIDKGFTDGGNGGFHNTDTREFAKPRTMDSLRSKINQKETYFEIPFQAPPKSTDKRAVVAAYSKNKPETSYAMSADNLFRTTGAMIKEASRPEIAMKDNVKSEMHAERVGNVKFENLKSKIDDDYGRKNIIIYDNERMATQTKTVVSNVTSTIKSLISPVIDTLKYTMKEFLVDAPRAVGNSSAQIPKKMTTYNPDDTVKTTVKETLLHDSEVINLSGTDKAYSALHDEAKTTVKETMLHDSEVINLAGHDNTYSALHDDAKTTVKETLIHDGEYLNVRADGRGYTKAGDKMRRTIKETLPFQDTVRNIGKNEFKVYAYDADSVVVKKTTKETTIKGKSEYGFLGGILSGLIGGYATKEIDLRNSHKQFTTVEEYGVAHSALDHRQMSREADENAVIDPTRERMLIDAGHTPNPGRKNIPNDKNAINMKSNKHYSESYAQRNNGNVGVIYQSGPDLKDCSLTRDKEENNAFKGRLDSGILDSLKDNDFSIKINPITQNHGQ